MASSDSDKSDTDETVKPFKGITFYIHGQWAGWTRNKVTRALESGGGQVSDKLENVKISHMIVSEQLWSRRSTANADPTIKRTMKANEENRTEEDEDWNRVWLLPIEWLEQSLQEGSCLPEVEHDLERMEDEKRAERSRELAKERRKYGGTSRYGRGQRRKIEMQRAMDAELRRQAQVVKQGLAPDPDAFAGVAMLPGAFDATPWGPASSGTGHLASDPLGASSNGTRAQENTGSSAAPANAAPASSFASQSSQQIDLSSPDPLTLERRVHHTSKMSNGQASSTRTEPAAGRSTGKPRPAKEKEKSDWSSDDMTSSSDEEPPSAKAGKKRNEKKARQQAKAKPATGSSDKSKATMGKLGKSAREQALEATAKSPSKPKADSAALPAAASQPKKTQFNDFRKQPLTLFSGGSRHMPSKPNKPTAGASNETRVKQADKGKPAAKIHTSDGGSSSDEVPLKKPADPRRTRSKEAKRAALGEKSRNAKTDEKAKPSFKVDANGKKRARFVGDTSDEDEAPRSTKKGKTGAQKAKKAAAIVISDSDSE